MKGLLNLILTYLPVLFIAYAGYDFYDKYTIHEQLKLTKETIVAGKDREIKIDEEKVKQVEVFKKNIESAKKRIEEVAVQIDQVQRQLPEVINDTDILGSFQKEADLIRISNIFLKPSEEKEEDFYFKKQYMFKGTGTYLQFVVFFERLNQKDRLLNVHFLKMNRSQEKKKGRFQLVEIEALIEAFKYNPNKADQIKKSIETIGQNTIPQQSTDV